MNKIEVGQLLIIASGFDRFITPERVPVESWHLLLDDVDYTIARDAVVEFYRTWDGKGQLTVAYILETVARVQRSAAREIAIDVNAARARGLVDKDWDTKTALPPGIAEKLAQARAAELAEAKRVVDEYHAMPFVHRGSPSALR